MRQPSILVSHRVFGLAAAFSIGTCLHAQSPSPRSGSAAVESAASVYRDVEHALKRGQLHRRDTTVTCQQSGLDARAVFFTDRRHRLRRLDTDGGTDDHAEQVAIYFDTLGRARFAFVQRGAVNGTHQEERVYYDERTKAVRRQVRRVRGPGYPFDTLTTVTQSATLVHDLCG